MADQPWYHAGLKFTCTQCGNCCTGTPGFVWVTDEEIDRIAAYLDKPVGEIRLMYTRPARGKTSLTEYANGDCVFFDPESRRCTIYPVRPIQCQTWPFWKMNLSTRDDWKETKATCPGLDTGAFISLDEIENRLSQTDI